MTSRFTRTDRSLLSLWWWTVDRWLLAFLIFISVFGAIFSFAATPMVAVKIGLPEFHFVKRHIIYTIAGLFVMTTISFLEIRAIKRFAVLLFLMSIILLVGTQFFGTEIKGAKRWINFGILIIQPSEFVKPAFAVLSAWMFSEQAINKDFPGGYISFGFYLLLIILMALQPDMGMIFVISAIWFGQLFLTGIPFGLVALFLVLGGLGIGGAYLLFPHVASRINRFIDPTAGDCYQINRSLEAFQNGGWFGVGPGEGIIKKHLPDAHADFVFSVIGEEFGTLVCVVVFLVYCLAILRSLIFVLKSKDTFVSFAVFGLIIQFAMQVFVNIGSSLHIIPTKGMTLPFISYGGSSMIALSLCLGMVLGLSRKRPMVIE